MRDIVGTMTEHLTESEVKERLKVVRDEIQEAAKTRSQELHYMQPRLVGVTKLRPLSYIIAAYEEGLRDFGENYVQEFYEKATDPEILQKCKDIRWHFIGHLQTNKVNKVLSIPNLHIVETVDTEKLAGALDKAWPKYGTQGSKLRVFVQVNTSGEKEKSGMLPSEVCNVAQYIAEQCPNLQLDGLMCIGKLVYDYSQGPNNDFVCLQKCREEVCRKFGWDWKKLELSMGTTVDYLEAVKMGSTNVRVGTKIFGARPKKQITADD